VVVADDGRGVDADFDASAGSSLGLSIVRTLVETELGGQLAIRRAGPEGGTLVELDLLLPS
jgi:two-component sensor histidine kinase